VITTRLPRSSNPATRPQTQRPQELPEWIAGRWLNLRDLSRAGADQVKAERGKRLPLVGVGVDLGVRGVGLGQAEPLFPFLWLLTYIVTVFTDLFGQYHRAEAGGVTAHTADYCSSVEKPMPSEMVLWSCS
jgi:hypothetical protein